MEWIALNAEAQLDEIDRLSFKQPVLIFKHSTRCIISLTALDRLERAWKDPQPARAYYLDLLNYRSLSQQIADRYKVIHQSPQVLLIREGTCTYHESHGLIRYDAIQEAAA